MEGSTVGNSTGKSLADRDTFFSSLDTKSAKVEQSKRFSCPGLIKTNKAAFPSGVVAPVVGNKIVSANEPLRVRSTRPTHFKVSIPDDHSSVRICSSKAPENSFYHKYGYV